jgi:hypothetical protein
MSNTNDYGERPGDIHPEDWDHLVHRARSRRHLERLLSEARSDDGVRVAGREHRAEPRTKELRGMKPGDKFKSGNQEWRVVGPRNDLDGFLGNVRNKIEDEKRRQAVREKMSEKIDEEVAEWLEGVLAEADESERRDQEAKARQKATQGPLGYNPVQASGRGHLAVRATSPDDAAPTVRVGNQPLTYGPGNPENSWFRDVYLLRMRRSGFSIPDRRDPELTASAADDRLRRHAEEMVHLATRGNDHERQTIRGYLNEAYREEPVSYAVRDFRNLLVEKRDTSTGGMAFTPPLYLLDRAAWYRTSVASVASQAGQGVLPPSGMSVVVPQPSSGLTVSTQNPENTDPGVSSPTTGEYTADVQTHVGYAYVSQQALDRTGPGITMDEILMKQGALQAATDLELKTITAVLAGATTLIDNGTPGAQRLYSGVARAAESIEATEGVRLSPTHVFLPPVSLRWQQSQLGSSGLPVFPPAAGGTGARVGEVGTSHEGYAGFDLLGAGVWSAPELTNASAGWYGPLVSDATNGLLVLLGTPRLEVFIDGANAQTFTATCRFIQYSAVVVLYPSAHVAVTGSAWPASPSYS